MTISRLNEIEKEAEETMWGSSTVLLIRLEDLKEILELARNKLQDIEDTNRTGQDAPQ